MPLPRMRSGQSSDDAPVSRSKEGIIYALITEFIASIYYNALTYVVHQEIMIENAADPPKDILDMGAKREILAEKSILPFLRGIFMAGVIESETIPEEWLEDESYVELAKRVMTKSAQYDQALAEISPAEVPAMREAMVKQAVLQATERVIAEEGLESTEDEAAAAAEAEESTESDSYNSDMSTEEIDENSDWQEHCLCELCTEMRSHVELWAHWTPEAGSLEEILAKAIDNAIH